MPLAVFERIDRAHDGARLHCISTATLLQATPNEAMRSVA
jgi:hypothetical protein